MTDFRLNQCFFGEHLLPNIRDKPVALVESEKTATFSSTRLDRVNLGNTLPAAISVARYRRQMQLHEPRDHQVTPR